MTLTHSFLEPRHTAQKSFYQKAVVTFESDGTIRLYSYGVWVATVCPDVYYILLQDAAYSKTTVKHVNEFLLQYADLDKVLSVGEIRKRIDQPQEI